jgi:hypothetical protein
LYGFDLHSPGWCWIAKVLWRVAYQSSERTFSRIRIEKREFFKTFQFVHSYLLLSASIINVLLIISDLKRDFLAEFARSKNFDPLNAEKWYSITRKDILQAVSSCL